MTRETGNISFDSSHIMMFSATDAEYDVEFTDDFGDVGDFEENSPWEFPAENGEGFVGDAEFSGWGWTIVDRDTGKKYEVDNAAALSSFEEMGFVDGIRCMSLGDGRCKVFPDRRPKNAYGTA